MLHIHRKNFEPQENRNENNNNTATDQQSSVAGSVVTVSYITGQPSNQTPSTAIGSVSYNYRDLFSSGLLNRHFMNELASHHYNQSVIQPVNQNDRASAVMRDNYQREQNNHASRDSRRSKSFDENQMKQLLLEAQNNFINERRGSAEIIIE